MGKSCHLVAKVRLEFCQMHVYWVCVEVCAAVCVAVCVAVRVIVCVAVCVEVDGLSYLVAEVRLAFCRMYVYRHKSICHVQTCT